MPRKYPRKYPGPTFLDWINLAPAVLIFLAVVYLFANGYVVEIAPESDQLINLLRR